MPLTLSALQPLAELAGRAPSAHNTQPWLLEAGPERLVLRADPKRHLAHGDPTERDLRLSLGAFARALELAAPSFGIALDREASPTGVHAAWRVSTGAIDPSAQPLVSLLRRRETSRLAFAPELPEALLEPLHARASTLGLGLELAPNGGERFGLLAGWLRSAVREGWLDARANRELDRWLHLDLEGRRAPEDGLSTDALALDLPTALLMKAMVKRAPWLAGALADAEVAAATRCPALVVVVAREGSGADCGGGLLELWLEATRLGLALQPLSVLLDRRGWELGRHLGVSPSRLVAVLRLGRSAPAFHSRRRPVASWLSWRGG